MQDDVIDVDPKLLSQLNFPVPRYTSYPTAPQFQRIEPKFYRERLLLFDQTKKPLSLYLHIPFCEKMCLFCGCSVVLNRKPERQQNYFNHLIKEIEMVAKTFSSKRDVSQLHLGGGTPTSLSQRQFECLIEKIHNHFTLLQDAEISIEVDPRTVFSDRGAKLSTLKKLGFNRVSFGVQDLDPVVQEAVRRRQSEEVTVWTYLKARELGFKGINVDLIYGLPYQTAQSFSKTANRLIELGPDRIAFYSYAKVPWLKKHQRAIPEKTLPSFEEKFRIYVDARARFMNAGYVAIGMDHFSKKQDPMSKAYLKKNLTRNFQGYSVKLAEDLLGFGLSSVGFIQNAYFQNHKDLNEYLAAVKTKSLAVQKGYLLNDDDLHRRRIILDLMCHFEIEKKRIPKVNLEDLKLKKLIEETETKIRATPIGRLFIRIIAAKFDRYIHQGKFSKAI